MAIPYWIPVAIAVAVVALTYGVQLLLAEVFPWQMLRAHKHGKPTVSLAMSSCQGRSLIIEILPPGHYRVICRKNCPHHRRQWSLRIPCGEDVRLERSLDFGPC